MPVTEKRAAYVILVMSLDTNLVRITRLNTSRVFYIILSKCFSLECHQHII